MHGNDELGQDQSAALLGVGEHPDAAENVVGQTRLLEYLLGRLAVQHAPVLERLPLEQAGVLSHLLRRQRRDAYRGGRAAPLGLQYGRWGRRGGSGCDAVKLGNGAGLKRDLGRGLAAGLGVPNKPQDNAEAGGREEAPVLLVGDLPYLCSQDSSAFFCSNQRRLRLVDVPN
jgi:hypothetical protein